MQIILKKDVKGTRRDVVMQDGYARNRHLRDRTRPYPFNRTLKVMRDKANREEQIGTRYAQLIRW